MATPEQGDRFLPIEEQFKAFSEQAILQVGEFLEVGDYSRARDLANLLVLHLDRLETIKYVREQKLFGQEIRTLVAKEENAERPIVVIPKDIPTSSVRDSVRAFGAAPIMKAEFARVVETPEVVEEDLKVSPTLSTTTQPLPRVIAQEVEKKGEESELSSPLVMVRKAAFNINEDYTDWENPDLEDAVIASIPSLNRLGDKAKAKELSRSFNSKYATLLMTLVNNKDRAGKLLGAKSDEIRCLEELNDDPFFSRFSKEVLINAGLRKIGFDDLLRKANLTVEQLKKLFDVELKEEALQQFEMEESEPEVEAVLTPKEKVEQSEVEESGVGFIDPFRDELIRQLSRDKDEEEPKGFRKFSIILASFAVNEDGSGWYYPDKKTILDITHRKDQSMDSKLASHHMFAKGILEELFPTGVKSVKAFGLLEEAIQNLKIHPLVKRLNPGDLFDAIKRKISFEEALEKAGLTLEQFKEEMKKTYGEKSRNFVELPQNKQPTVTEETEVPEETTTNIAPEIVIKKEEVVEERPETKGLVFIVRPLPEERDPEVDLSEFQERVIFEGIMPNEERNDFLYPSIKRRMFPTEYQVADAKKGTAQSRAIDIINDSWYAETKTIEPILRGALENPDKASQFVVRVLQRLSTDEIGSSLTLEELMRAINKRSLNTFNNLLQNLQNASVEDSQLRFRQLHFAEPVEPVVEENSEDVKKN